ncbi:hypothetical protein SAMN05892883_3116 [Jatrophihabitans sp. GAS493]|nr:hypothetical protein SAMN05892883_3116 [Jatrophihabitans sp. GAS493]
MYSLNSSGAAIAYGMVVARKTSNAAYGFYTPAHTILSTFGVSIRVQ